MSQKIVDILHKEVGHRAIIDRQDAKGIAKYGDSLRVDTCTKEELTRHLHEEIADALVYARALQEQGDWLEEALCERVKLLFAMIEGYAIQAKEEE